jgi:hypothetical protein
VATGVNYTCGWIPFILFFQIHGTKSTVISLKTLGWSIKMSEKMENQLTPSYNILYGIFFLSLRVDYENVSRQNHKQSLPEKKEEQSVL